MTYGAGTRALDSQAKNNLAVVQTKYGTEYVKHYLSGQRNLHMGKKKDKRNIYA